MQGKAKSLVSRPQTAATSSLKDETRILAKLKYLEKIEQRIEEYLEEFVNRRGDKEKQDKKGIHITKQILLECSHCDTVEQISTLNLRDKNIAIFD